VVAFLKPGIKAGPFVKPVDSDLYLPLVSANIITKIMPEEWEKR
jgi:hypothetical protein